MNLFMKKDKLKKDEFVELLYQSLTRNFDASQLLKKVNYPILNLYIQDETLPQKAMVTAYIFYCWIIMFSVRRLFPNIYKEVLGAFLEILWERGNIKKEYKNLENFISVVELDFDKYEDAISDENDPMLKLCTLFLNHLFNREVTDVRAIHYVSAYFYERSKIYNKIFSRIEIL